MKKIKAFFRIERSTNVLIKLQQATNTEIVDGLGIDGVVDFYPQPNNPNIHLCYYLSTVRIYWDNSMEIFMLL
jgi:hypothetical protein